MGKTLRRLAACALLALATHAPAAQRTQTVTLGHAPAAAYADAVSGKLFVASEALPRGGAALTVLERNGRLATLPLEGAALAISGESALRKLLVAQAGGVAAIVHLDSLKVTPVPVAGTPMRVALSERAGEGYVLSRHGEGLAITAIDLRTLVTRTNVVRDVAPIAFAADSAAARLYVLGTRGEANVVQAFNAATLEPTGKAATVGTRAADLAIAAGGDTLAVIDHAETPRGLRAQLRLMDTGLATQKVLALPEGRYAETRGAALDGEVVADGTRPRWWIRDAANARILLVNAPSGAVNATDLESPPASLAVNSDKAGVIAVMPLLGQAALLSPAGERLDTVVVGHVQPGEAVSSGAWPIAIDAGTGDAYVGHGVEGTLTALPRDAEPGTPANLTDLWFNPQEPGWGLFVEQQSTTAFAALFTYSASGEATWLVMSSGARQPDGSFSGVLFRTDGPSRATGANVTPVGIMRLVPGTDGLTLTYVAEGNSVTKKVQRFAAEGNPRACRWSANPDATPVAQANFTALWSNPVDPGWGLAVSHRRQSLFAVLFTYDEQGRPAWRVMSNGRQQAAGQFSGDLYKVAKGRVEAVGTMSLRFGAADEGLVTYRLDGTDFRAPLLKQRFAPLVSRCAG